MNPLNHVAIIMDGNGRWGLKYKNSRNAGHKAGINTVEKIIKETLKQNIKYLTLYAFSTENWKRPQKEINYLFNLLEKFLINRIEDLSKQEIKLKIIGVKKFSKTDVVAIGGINLQNYKKVLLNKANFLAISNYIWKNKTLNPEEALNKLK